MDPLEDPQEVSRGPLELQLESSGIQEGAVSLVGGGSGGADASHIFDFLISSRVIPARAGGQWWGMVSFR